MTRPRVAVVTVAHGRHDHLAAQSRTVEASGVRPHEHVVVAMADPAIAPVSGPVPRRVLHLDADPDRLPLARARNAGFAAAVEAGAEVVIGLDVDCLAGPDLVAAYAEVVMAHPGSVWSGPVTYLPPPSADGYPLHRLAELDRPHPGRPAPAPGTVDHDADPNLFWSLSFALHARAWARSGGFDPGYVGYGAEDTDFARRAARAGLGFGWVGSARAYHQHHPVSDPPVEHVTSIVRNANRFHQRWGEWPMRGWLDEFERTGLVVARGDGYALRGGD